MKLEFEAAELDVCNWVVDFGSLKGIKSWLEHTFDHTLLVAEDDPERVILAELHDRDIVNIRFVPSTGCEAFAQLVYEEADKWLFNTGLKPRVKLVSVEVREHGTNSAIYTGT